MKNIKISEHAWKALNAVRGFLGVTQSEAIKKLSEEKLEKIKAGNTIEPMAKVLSDFEEAYNLLTAYEAKLKDAQEKKQDTESISDMLGKLFDHFENQNKQS